MAEKESQVSQKALRAKARAFLSQYIGGEFPSTDDAIQQRKEAAVSVLMAPDRKGE